MYVGFLFWRPATLLPTGAAMDSMLAQTTAPSQSAGDAASLGDQETPFTRNLANEVKARWQYAYRHKQQYINPRLFDCHQRRIGQYDAQKLAMIRDLNGSEQFLKHTALKCRAAQSWIRDVLMPGKGQPWGVEPTPVPDLPPEDLARIEQEVMNALQMEMMMSGMEPTPDMAYGIARELRDNIDARKRHEAKTRSARMDQKINDLFVEGGFNRAMSDFIDDITTFPTAILKGPCLQRTKSLEYGPNGMPFVRESIAPHIKRISPWDIFPSPECANVNDGYIFERRRVTKHELLKLRGAPGYDSQRIAFAIAHTNYSTGLESAIEDSQRGYLESKDTDAALGTEDGRLELIEYWGEALGQWLIDWGMDPKQIPDPTDDYQICAVMVNGYIIRAVLNPDPLGRRPYYATSYEKRTDSFWGVAIPELMDGIQDMMNSAVRNMQDNIAFASGPQANIDLDALDPKQHATANKIHPRKIWLTRSSKLIGGGSKAVEFFQPDMNAREIIDVIGKLERMADDHTGIPAYSYGSDSVKGAGETMGGLSMLMQAASKGIRQVIANIGLDVLIPLVEAMFLYCMLYVDDPAIKGDAKVHARGALAQVIREQLAVNRTEFAMGMMQDPDVKALLGPAGVGKIVRHALHDLELDDAMPSEDEVQRNIQAQARQQAMMQSALSEPAAAGQPPAGQSQPAPAA